MARPHFVYILSSLSGTLYVGMSGDLTGRMRQHKDGTFPGFTKRYKVDRLVYYEEYPDKSQAFARERRIKRWRRDRKIALIEEVNPEWNDLSDEIWRMDTRTTQRYV